MPNGVAKHLSVLAERRGKRDRMLLGINSTKKRGRERRVERRKRGNRGGRRRKSAAAGRHLIVSSSGKGALERQKKR